MARPQAKKRQPSSGSKSGTTLVVAKRNFKKEYASFHGQPKQIERRAARNKARRLMVKMGRARKGDGREVDHIRPLARGGSRGIRNLRVVSRATNRKKGKKMGSARK